MKVNIDIPIDMHFSYGAIASCAGAVGILIGFYVKEAVSFPILIVLNASYVGFLFAVMWRHQSHLNYHAESVVREHRQEEYRQGVLERQLNPIQLEPVDMELSSLRRAQ